VIDQNNYSMSVEFNSTISGAVWVITNVYAPCTAEGKIDFLNWLHDFILPDETDWLLVGDFNLIRRPRDRNRPRGNIQDTMRFNEVISNLGVDELPLYGNRYTWSNKQAAPLLERLNWFFASVSWITSYPGSVVSTPSRDVSDHHPCLILMNTDIPKAKTFRFENHWLLHEKFMPVMQLGWYLTVRPMDSAKKLMAKFKNLRRVLRCWYAQISNLATAIHNNKLVLSFMDNVEEFRDLSLEEWNFRQLVQVHLSGLLEQ
jgi:hypothetical protein